MGGYSMPKWALASCAVAASRTVEEVSCMAAVDGVLAMLLSDSVAAWGSITRAVTQTRAQ